MENSIIIVKQYFLNVFFYFATRCLCQANFLGLVIFGNVGHGDFFNQFWCFFCTVYKLYIAHQYFEHVVLADESGQPETSTALIGW